MRLDHHHADDDERRDDERDVARDATTDFLVEGAEVTKVGRKPRDATDTRSRSINALNASATAGNTFPFGPSPPREEMNGLRVRRAGHRVAGGGGSETRAARVVGAPNSRRRSTYPPAHVRLRVLMMVISAAGGSRWTSPRRRSACGCTRARSRREVRTRPRRAVRAVRRSEVPVGGTWRSIRG